MSVDGCVKWFDLLRGFGFIEITSGKDSGTDVFVHACDVEGRPLMEQDKVTMDIGDDDRSGKDRAMHVRGGTGREDAREAAKGDKGKGKRYDSRERGRGGGRYDDRDRGGRYGDRYGSPRGDRYRSRRDSRDRGNGKGRGDKGKGKGDEKGSQTFKPGDWICDKCDFMNFASRNRCMKCNADRPTGARSRGDGNVRGDSRARTGAAGGRDRSASRGGGDDGPRGGGGKRGRSRSRSPPRGRSRSRSPKGAAPARSPAGSPKAAPRSSKSDSRRR
mmetsp:Transcript_2936/g.6715  ORF Transcript_2936/g.6715 Transcript_2936/m.6715 type:complete len:274 (-) Transcript_2936:647-1468(-)|eukprot:g4665.t1